MDELINHWIFYSFIIGMIAISSMTKRHKLTTAYRLLKIRE